MSVLSIIKDLLGKISKRLPIQKNLRLFSLMDSIISSSQFITCIKQKKEQIEIAQWIKLEKPNIVDIEIKNCCILNEMEILLLSKLAQQHFNFINHKPVPFHWYQVN